MSLELVNIIPPLPRVVRGKSVVFGEDPKGNYVLYGNGNSVIIRNLKDVSKNDMYTQHSGAVNVAKYSPSGFYIASADKFGKVRIWDTVNAEHVLKNEFQPFSGPICDLAWTSDNQRIIVGGTGQSQFGAVFNAETGASVGVIMGVSKNINSVDFRPTRPYRAITGNDEGLVNYFEGPPFTFKHYFKHHTTFVNIVRFCPSGTCFVSGGADGKIFVYDAQAGSTIGEVGSPAHSGGVYGICFSTDGSRMLSGSADKTLKLWKVEGQEISALSTHQFPNDTSYMVLGCCWVGDTVVALTFNGFLHLFDAPTHVNSLSEPRMVIAGHQTLITCGVYNKKLQRLITASSDANMASWDLQAGLAEMFFGEHTHKAQVQSIALCDNYLVSVGLDDRCVLANITEKSFIASIKLPSQPHCVGVMPIQHIAVVACDKHICLLSASNRTLSMLDHQEISCGPCTITVSPQTETAIVCSASGQIMAYKTMDGKLHKTQVMNPPSPLPIMGSYSPDGSMLALVDADRTVTVHKVSDERDINHAPVLTPAHSEWWQRQTARITAIGWSPNGRRLATGSLDTSIAVWSVDSPKTTIYLRNAHPMSSSTSLCWTDDFTLVSTAMDGSIRCWTVKDK
ncbi:WD domain, G-beta repeat protein [Opisthorchis viverrini]|uniref:WD domain, G-beta repeat protein n=1 Tax=Opisthorchis viverrini TaxID=6198 RepID=A0A1S8WH45_OPIVI|nr:WD domain, G-beta repeat protein [Opisthorchis viverrini]